MAAGPAQLSMLGPWSTVCGLFAKHFSFFFSDTYLISWFFLEFPGGFLPSYFSLTATCSTLTSEAFLKPTRCVPVISRASFIGPVVQRETMAIRGQWRPQMTYLLRLGWVWKTDPANMDGSWWFQILKMIREVWCISWRLAPCFGHFATEDHSIWPLRWLVARFPPSRPSDREPGAFGSAGCRQWCGRRGVWTVFEG